MESLPSTLQLHQLRQIITCSKKGQQEYGLLQLRQKVIDVTTSRKEGLSLLEPYFFQAWAIFSQRPSNDVFYLPPLYKSELLNSILQAGIECLLKREVGIVNGCDNNVGHLVLGGVEGAGKTTLMRALALAAAALLQRMIPITHNYLDFKEPEAVLWDALKICLDVSRDNEMDPLDILNENGRQAFLLFDDFQHNFRRKENPDWLLGRKAATVFHRYSRTSGTYGVVSGSSVDMHSLMFQRGRGDNMDYWRKCGYPNFNGTLYKLYTIPTLRTIAALKEYTQVRYPLWELKDNDLSLLLSYTGGIGRWVNEVWERCGYMEELVDGSGQRGFCTVECLQQCTSYRKINYDKFLENSDNRELVAYLLQTARPERDVHGHVVNCGGVRKSQLIRALSRVNVGSPTDVVEEVLANSVIYIDEGSNVQFSRPVDELTLRSSVSTPMHKLLLLSAVRLMICGVCDDSSGDITDVNAGNALEELVREDVYKAACINESAEFRSDIKLSIDEGKLCLIRRTDNVVLPMTVELLSSLNLVHLSWNKEHGLDGVCFEKDVSREHTWHLDLWQCKGGRRDAKIGGGNNSMNTALNNYKKSHQLKDVGDKQITEIALKAQVGICIIVKALRKAIPGVIVKPRRFVIATTKQLSEFCVKTLKSWQNAGGMSIENYILTLFEMNSKSKWDKALKSKFEVRIESGCQWVVDAIREEEARGVVKQLLEPTYGAATASGKGTCVLQ